MLYCHGGQWIQIVQNNKFHRLHVNAPPDTQLYNTYTHIYLVFTCTTIHGEKVLPRPSEIIII